MTHDNEYSIFIKVIEANDRLLAVNNSIIEYNQQLSNDIQALKEFAIFMKPFISNRARRRPS